MKEEFSKGCYKEGGRTGRKILPMAKKADESELRKLNMYVDSRQYKKSKKFFSIALLEYKDNLKKVFSLNGTETIRQSIPIVIYKAIGKLNKNCVVNVYAKNCYGLKTIMDRYESGITPPRSLHSQHDIDLINLMRTSGHIVKINLYDDWTRKEVIEENLKSELDDAISVICSNEKWSNLNKERIDELCLDMIYEIQKEYMNAETIDKEKFLRLSINKKDDFSKLKFSDLKARISRDEYSKIERTSYRPKDISEMIRWSCRGLGTDLAIEKFLIDTANDK